MGVDGVPVELTIISKMPRPKRLPPKKTDPKVQ